MRPSIATAVAGMLALGMCRAVPAQDAGPTKPAADKKAQCKAMQKEKWAAKARELATAADTDANGSLSEQEFDPLRKAAKQAEKDLKKACEVACGTAKAEKPKASKPAKAPDPAKEKAKAEKKAAEMKPWDKDGDGKLSEAEKNAKKEAEDKADLAKDFKKADTNGDGKLSIDEAVKAIR